MVDMTIRCYSKSHRMQGCRICCWQFVAFVALHSLRKEEDVEMTEEAKDVN